jgi:RHH-type proline utilization regulon transcriptional repressor/proline dehydrogenase/delta 1-pyrroline-5-carboxylate dehydrogenase
LAEQHQAIAKLIIEADLSPEARHQIRHHAAQMVCRIRADAKPAKLEVFLAEYGLSNAKGTTLMRLSEALLRDPDASTIVALVAEKIAPEDWAADCGHAASALVNTSTLELLTTSRVLSPITAGTAAHLSHVIKRLSVTIIRRAMTQAMPQMGRQFVLGQTIQTTLKWLRTLVQTPLHS